MPLTDAETQIVIAEFLSFIAITVIFSLLSLETVDKVKSLILKAISMVMWFMVALFNLAIAPVDYVTQVAPTVLFFGFGLLWLVLLMKSTIETMKLGYEKKYSVTTL